MSGTCKTNTRHWNHKLKLTCVSDHKTINSHIFRHPCIVQGPVWSRNIQHIYIYWFSCTSTDSSTFFNFFTRGRRGGGTLIWQSTLDPPNPPPRHLEINWEQQQDDKNWHSLLGPFQSWEDYPYWHGNQRLTMSLTVEASYLDAFSIEMLGCGEIYICVRFNLGFLNSIFWIHFKPLKTPQIHDSLFLQRVYF